MFRSSFLYVAILIGSIVSAGKAESASDCPKSLVFVDKNIISEYAGSVIKKIYAELGCSVSLTGRPGRRAIMEFNTQEFDGEVSRISAVEKHYKTDFVRSSVPIFVVNGSIWGTLQLGTASPERLGFVRGIVWQENYIKGKRGLGFDSYADMYEGYERGIIDAFLSPDQHVFLERNQGRFKRPLDKKSEIFSRDAYHYLQAKFSPFMESFSEYIETHDEVKTFEQ